MPTRGKGGAKVAEVGPAPALCSPHPHLPATLCWKKAFGSYQRGPKSGLALLWHRYLDLLDLRSLSSLPASGKLDAG